MNETRQPKDEQPDAAVPFGRRSAIYKVTFMSVVFFLITFVTSKADARWNSSWLANVDYNWWNLFTTRHYLAWLSLHNPFLHVVLVAAMTAVLTTVCMVFMKRKTGAPD